MPRNGKYGDLKVLYVDDEEQSLKYFKLGLNKVVDVLTASNADQALDVLDENRGEVGVLISDQRMPGRSGVELLGEVRYRNPEVVRVLTTAYAELDDAITAVNSGAIFAYVTKPWNLKDLQATIVQALELSRVQRERDLLLREKLGVLQQQLLVDRLRSASVLAAALGASLHNTTTAAFEFMTHALAMPDAPLAENKMDVWEALRAEIRDAVNVAKGVAGAVGASGAPHPEFDTARAWAAAAERARVGIEVSRPDDLPVVATDAALLEKAFEVMLYALSKHAGKDARLAATGEPLKDVWGGRGLRWRLTFAEFPGPALREAFLGRPREAGPSLLGGYFLVYHLGGRVRIDQGGGVSVELPVNGADARVEPPDDDWAEMLFDGLETSSSSRRGPP